MHLLKACQQHITHNLDVVGSSVKVDLEVHEMLEK